MGTSVVSLILPAGANLTVARSRLAKEQATAVNIKDKTNRHSVVDALKAVADELSCFKTMPATGLAVFAGYACRTTTTNPASQCV